MLKSSRFLILLFLLVTGFITKAQFVTIPDSVLIVQLHRYGIDSCWQGNQLDTTCPALQHVRYINVSYKHINDLEGIQYFKNLDSLKCNADTTLTHIPALANSIQVLECRNNQLDSLPELPASLRRLACEFNNLQTLPSLPSQLQFLTCYNNQLRKIPAVPSTLQVLFCSGNLLDSLPQLPSSLSLLSCYSNKIASLYPLPDSLKQFFASNNKLRTLPALPNGLQYLDCYNNQLTSLPALPAALKYLGCHYNQLSTLPALPSKLDVLNCGHNRLTSLPAVLPDSMSLLQCDSNLSLYCLPLLNYIYDLEFYQTGISCVSSYGNVIFSNPSLPSLPGCSADNNTHSCVVYSGITETDNLSFRLYPNPAQNQFSIEVGEESPGYSVELMDAVGKKLNEFELTNAHITITTSSMPDGIYFVKVKGEDGRSRVAKLIIE